MSETNFKGRVTIPTDVDVVPETLELVKDGEQTLSVTVTEQTIRKN